MIIKLAPALYLDAGCSFPEFKMTTELYQSRAQAEYELGGRLLDWLGGTPYEIEFDYDMDELEEIADRCGMTR